MTQKQMTYFEKAYEIGNIAQAAEELFVSRSVISRSIQDMEEEFGIALFERSKQGITPTKAGHMMHRTIQQILSSYSTLSNRFREMVDVSARRTLRIGVTPTNSRRVCRLVFGPFLERFPDVQMEILERESSATIALLSSNQADLIVGPGPSANFTAYEAIPLYGVRIVLALARTNPLSERDMLSVMDLLSCPLGFLSIPIPSAERVIESASHATGQSVNVAIRTSDLQILRELTEQGHIASIMPDDMIRDWNGVVGVPLDFMSQNTAHHLVWSSAAPLSSAGRDFVDFMRSYFTEHPAPPEEPARPAESGGRESGTFRSDGLPPDFFANLLDLPSCKSRGYCDNCGRCEH